MQVDADAVKAVMMTEIEQDRAAISRTIEKLQAELSTAPYSGKEAALTHGQRYRKLALCYYLKKNQAAAIELDDFVESFLEFASLRFLEEAQKLGAWTLNSKFLSSHPALLDQLNYSYRRHRTRFDIYHPDNLQEIDHRFLSLPAPVYDDMFPKIKIAYQSRQHSENYLELAENYIEDYVLPELKAYSRENPYLFRKAQVIDHVVERFTARDYISLSYVVPPLIEGTFQSICESLGLRAARLQKAALNQVVEHIKNHTKAIGMEYLLFIMPMRRNLIAHGRELDVTYREFAVGFLLDIDLLLTVAEHRTLPWNARLEIVKRPSVKAVKRIFTIKNDNVPSHVAEECRKLGDWLESSTFWDELGQQLTGPDIEQRETERFVRNLLKRSNELAAPDIASRIADRCLVFLKETLPAVRMRIKSEKLRLDEVIKKIKVLMAREES